MEPERETAERLQGALLEAIQEFFDQYLEKGRSSPPARHPQSREVRLATAALLLQMTRADFETSPEERQAVTKAVAQVLGVMPEAAREIVGRSEAGDPLSLPIRDLTRLIDENDSLEQKKQVVEWLWRVAFSDAQILAHEEYLVRKVADLLHLSTADLIETKVRAMEAFE